MEPVFTLQWPEFVIAQRLQSLLRRKDGYRPDKIHFHVVVSFLLLSNPIVSDQIGNHHFILTTNGTLPYFTERRKSMSSFSM